ncbi:hypothetical protein EDF36_0199 [Rathayibacter sp. PhB152]|nr:hypothetical protein EDF36_0199 [Rathayibacter sp. PhB152]
MADRRVARGPGDAGRVGAASNAGFVGNNGSRDLLVTSVKAPRHVGLLQFPGKRCRRGGRIVTALRLHRQRWAQTVTGSDRLRGPRALFVDRVVSEIRLRGTSSRVRIGRDHSTRHACDGGLPDEPSLCNVRSHEHQLCVLLASRSAARCVQASDHILWNESPAEDIGRIVATFPPPLPRTLEGESLFDLDIQNSQCRVVLLGQGAQQDVRILVPPESALQEDILTCFQAIAKDAVGDRGRFLMNESRQLHGLNRQTVGEWNVEKIVEGPLVEGSMKQQGLHLVRVDVAIVRIQVALLAQKRGLPGSRGTCGDDRDRPGRRYILLPPQISPSDVGGTDDSLTGSEGMPCRPRAVPPQNRPWLAHRFELVGNVIAPRVTHALPRSSRARR